MTWLCCKCPTSALDELITYETWLGYDRSGCKREGQARGLEATNHRGGEAQVESLANPNLSLALSVITVDSWLILVRIIGGLFNGFSNICVVLVMPICNLGI